MKSGSLLWVVADTLSTNAGFRIRAVPLMNALRQRGLSVQAMTYAELQTQLLELMPKVSAVVLSKPNDSTSYLCMRAFLDQGVPVAVDVFDNYLSWSPALAHRQLHWQWLRTLASASLVLTSTAYLQQVIATLHRGPLLRVPDPLPRIAASSPEAALAAAKWATPPQPLELLWFGIANNGLYSVGLEDLIDWRSTFVALRRAFAHRGGVRLTLCTNRVALLDATLVMLRSEGVTTRFVEWSEQACSELVAQAHVVLLPTNLSGFSLSKTHNRCSDALARRCLVLASPHGPYSTLGGAAFLRAAELVAFVERARSAPHIVDEAIAASLDCLSQDCQLQDNAARLHAALSAAEPAPARPHTPRVLIVARARLETVKLSRRLGYLTAGFADSVIQANLDFTLHVAATEPALAKIQMSEKGWASLKASVFRRVQMDLAESATHLVCRSGGWHVVIDKAGLCCRVIQLPDAGLAAALRVAKSLSTQSVHQVDRWYESAVELLVRLLTEFGLPGQEFASEEGGGWRAFARFADPGLETSAQQLQAFWQAHADCELAWGAPTSEVVA
jgi:hypothetical protein